MRIPILLSLISLATAQLSNNNPVDAMIDKLDAILAVNPNDFSTLYKKAVIRLSQGSLSKAREGFKEVLRVREFDQAYLQLAKIYLKLGEFKMAMNNVESFLAMGGNNGSQEGLTIKTEINTASNALKSAKKAFSSNPPNYTTCVDASTIAIEFAANSEELRLLRADCQLGLKEYDSTVGDLSRAATLSPDLSPHLLIRLSLISSLFLDHGLEIPTDSLVSLKRCLNSDPESKVCRKALKSLKKVEKELNKLRNWLESSRWGEVVLIIKGSAGKGGIIADLEALIADYQVPFSSSPNSSPLPSARGLDFDSPVLRILYSTVCKAYIQLNQSRKLAETCEDILKRDPEDLWGLVGKGEKAMAAGEWEEAVRALDAAFEKTGKADRDILARLQKAQRLLKQSTAKDYYKVLGLSRDADAKTIKRAYRKATLKAHPDKGGSESAMQAVNEAYEVLSKPELREQFDSGVDPNDQSSQRQDPFGGGGFNHFFQQQQGGGQQFFQQGGMKFNFG